MTIDAAPRLLLIDSYDSFTYNLASLFRRAIPGCSIYVIKNDRFTIDKLLPLLKGFSALIVGPGPGSPDNPHDIGIVKDLWKISDEYLLPIFGVCLGLQSLAVECGAQLKRLKVVKHGQVSHIPHTGKDLFEGVKDVAAVRYHSLHAVVTPGGEIEPLAWADDSSENGVVLMAARHKTRPFWGVQYHPESVLTDGGGLPVLQNFWRLARQWSKARGRPVYALTSSAREILGHPWPHIESYIIPPSPSISQLRVDTAILDLPSGLSIPSICETLGACDEGSPFVILDSAAAPGRYSIIASLYPASLQILYSVDESFVTLKCNGRVTHESLRGCDIWSWLSTFMMGKAVEGGRPEIPFWGGLIGMLSYELGVDSLGAPLRPHQREKNPHYDVNLVFVERSVVVDVLTGKVYVQSILPEDATWIKETFSRLRESSSSSTEGVLKQSSSATVQLPDRSEYISKIQSAQAYLRSGDSYELCLTAQTHLTVPRTISSWERYKLLRKANPAPHSAYLRLHPTTFLSSSPERFLSYSRPPDSLCQLRPIKGTIRKAPGITRAHAEEALRGSRKEVAENLMIVDLIRHDLHGVVGLDVDVTQFCGVEEYETVWQMVSVIEGRLPPGASNHQVGWKVLKSSLPPGSMTGAPKKRSVEILQSLEVEHRGVYSGVFGYWCVGGGGDWSVVIRSCFKYEDPVDSKDDDGSERWNVGAGGAITALSDPEAEWDEMLVKLQSVLSAFGVGKPRT